MRKLDREYLIKLRNENKKVYASSLILERKDKKFFSYSTNIEVEPLEEEVEFFSIILSKSTNYYFIGKESEVSINNMRIKMDGKEVKIPLKEYV